MECQDLSSMAYEPRESLWKLVEESVSAEETEEIREILGESLVDQSLDLHTEASALLEIWQNFKNETDDVMYSQPKSLPEPPGMRDSLRDHIKMLVENIREKARIGGRDAELLLNDNKRDIIEYAMEGSSRGSSPGIVRSRPSSSISSRSGRETPMRMTPSSEEDRLSESTSASEKVSSLRDSLNVMKIDDVVLELRSALKDEVAQLMSDIRFLQHCLEDEKEFRCESQMSVHSEPSLRELREERSRLEKMSTSVPEISNVITNSSPVRRRSMPGSPKQRPTLMPLSPISTSNTQKVRPSPPSSAKRGQTGLRTLPLRAKHSPVTGYRPQENIQSNIVNQNSLSCDKLSNSKTTGSNIDPLRSSGNRPSSSSPIQPSPPSSAKRQTGSPTSNRFRQRFREVQRQNSSS